MKKIKQRRRPFKGLLNEFYHKRLDRYFTLKEMADNEFPALLPHCSISESALSQRIIRVNADQSKHDIDDCIGIGRGTEWEDRRREIQEDELLVDDRFVKVNMLMKPGSLWKEARIL